MTDRIILDLGEYGEISVEVPTSDKREEGFEQTGLRETARKAGAKTRIAAENALRLPLTGLGKLLAATLPNASDTELWQLGQFSFEFELGMELEAGANMGVVTVVKPNGGFKCTYTWDRKP